MLTKYNSDELLITKELNAFEFRDIAGVVLQKYIAGDIDHFVFDVETKGLDFYNPDCGFAGFSFCDPYHKIGYFIGYDHPGFYVPENEKAIIISCLFKLLYVIPTVGHNLIFDLSYLAFQFKLDMTRVRVKDDTLFLAYYIFGARRDTGMALSLKNIFRYTFDIDLVWEDELQKELNSHRLKKDRHFFNIPYEILSKYGAYDSVATYYLRLGLLEKVKNRVMTAYNYLLKAIHVFVELKTSGIAIDWEFRDFLIECYSKKIQDFEDHIQSLPIIKKYKEDTLSHFNIDSTKQVGNVLFGKDYYNCPVLTKTEKGFPSTNEESLLKLTSVDSAQVSEDAKKFCLELLENRNSVKMLSTYLEPLVERKFGDMYTPDYNLIGTATGRLSSYFHTLPSGNDIKRMITSRYKKEGGLIISSDFSQIEVKCIGFLSKDEKLKEAYIKGYDIHSYVASIMFDTSPELVSKTQRRKAKTIVFGILYGKGSFGLSNDLNIPREEAQKLVDFFFVGFPSIKSWIDHQHKFLKKNKFVQTKFGRIRYLRGIDSTEWRHIAEAQRAAQNTPIQSTASDIVLESTLKIYEELKTRNLKSKLIGTVHDSIQVDTHPDELFEIINIVHHTMNDGVTERHDFLNGVPITADIEIGTSWGGACSLEKFNEKVWMLKGCELDAKDLIERLHQSKTFLCSDFVEVEENEDIIMKFVNPGKKVKFKIVW